MKLDTDICIVGGGLVGLTAALAFAYQGRTVKLLEATDLRPAVPAAMDARSIALSYSTIQIFRTLGVWESLQENVAAIRQIHVSAAGHFGVTRLNAADLQLDAMGYVIEYHILIEALQQLVEANSHIELLTPALPEDVKLSETHVDLTLKLADRIETLQAGLLIVADGASSSVREKLGIATETRSYQQNAIICNVKIKRASEYVAYERFTAAGPLAMLPLPDQRYAMVWTNTPQRTDELMQLSGADFMQQVYRQFGYRLGLFEEVGSRDRFELKLSRAKKLSCGRAVLIGNAANTLHPVAGQGFNLALRDIALLFDVLEGLQMDTQQMESRLDFYQQQRVADQNQAVNYGNGLVQLFSNNLPVLNHLRAAALAALDLCPLMKKELSWQGMGYGPGCSSLMRGVK